MTWGPVDASAETTSASEAGNANIICTTSTDPHNDARDFQRRDDRATQPWRKKVNSPKACSAVLDEPRAPHSEQVAQEMRDRHPPAEKTSPRAHWSQKPSSPLRPTRQQHRPASVHSTSKDAFFKITDTRWCVPFTSWTESWTETTLLSTLVNMNTRHGAESLDWFVEDNPSRTVDLLIQLFTAFQTSVIDRNWSVTRHHRADPRRISEGRGGLEEEPRCYEARAIAHETFIKDIQRHTGHALRRTREGQEIFLPIVSKSSGHLRIMDLSVKAPPASASGPFPTRQSGPDNSEKSRDEDVEINRFGKGRHDVQKSYWFRVWTCIVPVCVALCEKWFVGWRFLCCMFSRGFSRQIGHDTRECKHFSRLLLLRDSFQHVLEGFYFRLLHSCGLSMDSVLGQASRPSLELLLHVPGPKRGERDARGRAQRRRDHEIGISWFSFCFVRPLLCRNCGVSLLVVCASLWWRTAESGFSKMLAQEIQLRWRRRQVSSRVCVCSTGRVLMSLCCPFVKTTPAYRGVTPSFRVCVEKGWRPLYHSPRLRKRVTRLKRDE